MNISQIDREMEKAYRRYGLSGDESLEYIGLIIQDNICSGTKVYRRLSEQCDEYEIVEDYKNLDFFKKIVVFAQIYDFSSRKDDEGREYMRLVFLPFKNVLSNERRFDDLLRLCQLYDYKNYFVQLLSFYAGIEFTGTSPLLKMGVELDDKGNVLEAKVYFALKSYDDKYDTLGRWHKYLDCKKIIDESLLLLEMKILENQFLHVGKNLEKIYYFPVFMGVNFSKDYTEMKVYYQTCFPDYTRNNILYYENELIKNILLNQEQFIELNHKYMDKGLFIDGISYSIIKDQKQGFSTPIWKPYYSVYTKDLARKREIDYYNYEPTVIKDLDYKQYQQVLLVDEKDRPVGTMDKNLAHRVGARHRAFSVFLHDGKKNMIIQKRAAAKYHSPSLWTNACCSHPFTKFIREEAIFRLKEELGISNVQLKEIFTFSYNEEVGNGLIENEIDHVFVGKYNGKIELNLEETDEIMYISFPTLLDRINKEPEKYTIWFRMAAARVIDYLIKETEYDRTMH